MALTYGYTRKHALKLLDEYATDGTVNTTDDVLVKIQDFTNDAMVDLASSTAKIHGEYFIAQNPVRNELAYDTSKIQTHLPDVDFTVELTGAKSYFFEATGPATVVIEEYVGGAWVALPTPISISIASSVTSFAEYKGLITAADVANKIRIRFTGSYVYKYRNYILYPYTWPSANDVQQHRPFFEYALPSDFLQLDNIMIKKETRQYISYVNYILRSDKKIALNRYDAPAEFMLHYWRYPTLFTYTGVEATDDAMVYGIDTVNSTYRVSDDAALVIPFYVAGHVLLSEGNPQGGITLLNVYETKKTTLVTNLINYQGAIFNATGW